MEKAASQLPMQLPSSRRSRRPRYLPAMLLLSVLTAAPAAGQGLLTQSAPPLSQQDETHTISTFGDWQLSCESKGEQSSCRMTIAGSTDAAGRPVAIQLASDAGNDAGQIFFFLTPLDLLLPKGIEMRVDGGPVMRLAYRSCHATGCIAPFRMSGTVLKRFRRGYKLDVRLYSLDGKPMDIALSLKGFTAAFKALSNG